MNILIVYTHPNHTSLNHSFLEATTKSLKSNSAHIYQVLDLYKENFDPTLIFNSDKRRRDMHQDPDTSIYRNQIKWADHIVYIYPIWWGRPPAMLLGYIDKLFSTNFAYRNIGKGYKVEGFLKGKRVTCISTMKGPTGYIQLFLNNAHRTLMKKALFSFVGIKKVKFFEFGGMETKKGLQEKNLKRIERYFLAL